MGSYHDYVATLQHHFYNFVLQFPVESYQMRRSRACLFYGMLVALRYNLEAAK